MRIVLPLIAAIATVVPAATIAADETPNLRPGLWEFTTELTMARGQEPVVSPPETKCLTAQDVRDFARAPVAEPGCSVDHVVSRERAETSSDCKVGGGEGRTETTAVIKSEYGGDRLQIRAVQNSTSEALSMEMQMVVTGRRIGDC